MIASDYYSTQDLLSKGLLSIGENVIVHKSVQLYLSSGGSIGNNVRIDGPSVITGKIDIGDNVHIGAFTRIAASQSSVTLGNDVGISSHCCLYAVTEDFLNPEAYGNPTHPSSLQHSVRAPIVVGSRVMVGTSAIILPGVHIGDDCSIAAGIILRKSIPSGSLAIPANSTIKLLRRRIPR
jgi:acetyltransferase-like isoleucine patch superfamily enzyme